MELSEINMSPKALAKSANRNVMIGFECEVNLDPDTLDVSIPATDTKVDIVKILDALVNDVDLELIFTDAAMHFIIPHKIDEIIEQDLDLALNLHFYDQDSYITYAASTNLYKNNDITQMKLDYKSKSGLYNQVYDYFVEHNTTRIGIKYDEKLLQFIRSTTGVHNVKKYYTKQVQHSMTDSEKDFYIDTVADKVDKELYGEWEAVEDGSLGPFGVEIRMTEPLPYQQALEALQNVKDFVKEHDGDTDKKCSLHVNISLPDTDVSQFNYLKALVLFNPTYVNRLFDRSMNVYCKSLLKKIYEEKQFDNYQTSLILQGIKKTVLNNEIHTQLSLSKLFGVLIRMHKSSAIEVKTNEGADKNRVEFRSIGGDWLDDADVLTTINRIATIYAACLPGGEELYKKEYLKGVYKIFSPKTNDMLGKTIAAYITNSVNTKTAMDAIQHIAQ